MSLQETFGGAPLLCGKKQVLWKYSMKVLFMERCLVCDHSSYKEIENCDKARMPRGLRNRKRSPGGGVGRSVAVSG